MATTVDAQQTTQYTTTAADFTEAVAYLQTLDAAANPYAELSPALQEDGSTSYEITVRLINTVEVPL